MDTTQAQQTINRQLSHKLDKIAKMLSIVIERMDSAAPDKKMINKIAKQWKEIDSGRMKVHHYKSLADFDKVLS